ncbi:sporulation protein rmd1 [Binucleata daphniae]
MKDDDNSNIYQRIPLNVDRQEQYLGKKQARIELRALKDAFPLAIVPDTQYREDVPEGIELKRVTAYCISEKIYLKNLSRHTHKEQFSSKSGMYFGECFYNTVKINEEDDETADIFYFDYGVVVCWGLQEGSEGSIIKNLESFTEGKYEVSKYEFESFNYGIVKENPRVINDVIYLNSESYFNKMVISNAIAQSVKLDYFENIVENTIESVRDLPEEVENEGKVGKSRREVFKMVGKLQRLRFNLNLISNILDEPEILWYHPEHQNLYESFNRYLEIKPRAAVLNQRCDVIKEILTILSRNINTRKREYYEKIICIFLFVLIIIGFVIMYQLHANQQKV